MQKEIKEFFSELDLSDFRLMFVGLLLLLLPLAYLYWVTGSSQNQQQQRRYATNVSRQSAFNLTPGKNSLLSSPEAKKQSFSVSPRVEKIDSELDRAWAKIQSTPRARNIPSDVPPETRQMIEAEDHEILTEGNTLLDSGDFAAAETAFEKAIKSSGGNPFVELYAWGGLMEAYEKTGNVIKFREAFSNYVKKAQELKHVYGPMADNIARAQQMFEQLAQADPAKIREHLLKHNLANQTNFTYDQLIKSLEETREWFPSNLEEPEPKLPDYLRRGYGG
ncbi:MAG: tetratricopeptide repeat protein [Candidatus Rifleibacteriota bacterium]